MGLRVSLLSAETRVPLLCTSVGNFHRVRKLTWCDFTAIGSQKPLSRTRDVSPVWLSVNLKCDWSKNISLLLQPWGKHSGFTVEYYGPLFQGETIDFQFDRVA